MNKENKEHPLHTAARAGDPALVREALKRHDTSTRDVHGETALHWASTVEVAKVLISAGADIKRVDPNGDTPLHWACENGNLALVQYFIECNADVNHANRRQDTPLHAAAASSDAEVVRLLLDAQADAKACNLALESPVHIASRMGEVSMVKALVKAGARIKTPAADGSVPMHEACKLPKGVQVVKYLIQRSCDVNVLTKTGRSPLQVAVKKRCKDIVDELCEKGADVAGIAKDAAARGHGWTALHVAAEMGSLKLCQAVVKKGGFDAEARTRAGDTPADVARKSALATDKVVKFLEEQIKLKRLAAGGEGAGRRRGGAKDAERDNDPVAQALASSRAGGGPNRSRRGSVTSKEGGGLSSRQGSQHGGSQAGSRAGSRAGSQAGSRAGSKAGSTQVSARGSPEGSRASGEGDDGQSVGGEDNASRSRRGSFASSKEEERSRSGSVDLRGGGSRRGSMADRGSLNSSFDGGDGM